ncbi:acetylxylan esterase [Gemella cuniculi]|uniref:acetylxylan esterase n=1 Tax=Gemella cuniculi TaxID=150240 RepID=UPI00041891D4|nr:acetylxylan esterase [Gemella cuniculi]
MKLEKNRNILYSKKQILKNHPCANCYEVYFYAIDNSKIQFDMIIPKDKIKGVIIEFPEYKVLNKDYLSLSRYCLLGYTVISVHIRGQAGNSENNISCSHFPLLNNYQSIPYYNYVFQDCLDVISITQEMFPNSPIFLCGVGQGGAISIVCSAINKAIQKIFVADVSLCDLENIYNSDNDINFYSSIREFIRAYPHKEKNMLKQLKEIDILSYSNKVLAKVYYCYSHLDIITPKTSQNKLINSIKDIEVINYKKLEYKKIFQHAFDEFLLKKLAED